MTGRLTLVFGLLAGVAIAQQGPRDHMGPLGIGPAMEAFGTIGPGPGGLMLGVLDLTDAQREQVRALTAEFNAGVEPHRTRMRESVQKMREVTAGGRFDEGQVRLVAEELAKANVEITVASQKLKADIYALLTAEQKARLDEAQPRMGERMRHAPMRGPR